MMSNSSTVIEDFFRLELKHTQVLMGASERAKLLFVARTDETRQIFLQKRLSCVCVWNAVSSRIECSTKTG